MGVVNVSLGGRSYRIRIEQGLLSESWRHVFRVAPEGEPLALVSDETVWNIYGQTLMDSLRSGYPNAVLYTYILSPGEGTKTIENLSKLYDGFAEAGIGRNGCVLAFGGGVIGDLAGLAAATWMRGVKLIQMPTTLLAQVDSSVGGKTAIDIPAGKNLVGAFHQPSLVLIDPLILESLPARDHSAGMAEVIKYGAIASAELFEKTNQNPEDIIEACCKIKAEIVEEDERDTGKRMLLNFGHTIGHAIETKYGYGKYLHGEAISIGMVFAAKIGEMLGVTETGTSAAISTKLSRYNLPTSESTEGLINIIRRDKKSVATGVDFVLIPKIGEAIAKKINFEELEELLRKL
jgi:3-dehydroquinate synthase